MCIPRFHQERFIRGESSVLTMKAGHDQMKSTVNSTFRIVDFYQITDEPSDVRIADISYFQTGGIAPTDSAP